MFLLSKQFAAARRVPEDFGFRHLRYKFLGDPVDVIIISASGERRVPRPLLLFCQGDGSNPVITYVQGQLQAKLPLAAQLFTDTFHVAVIGKPFMPVIGEENVYSRIKEEVTSPKRESDNVKFRERDHADYYILRNQFILKQLSSERWVRSNGTVVCGSGEGALVACRMAAGNAKISKLVYLGGNPYGPLIPPVADGSGHRDIEARWGCYGSALSPAATQGGELKKVRSFGAGHCELLKKLQIPVLMAYGTADDAAAMLKMFQIDCILQGIGHITHFSVTSAITNVFEQPVLPEAEDCKAWPQLSNYCLRWMRGDV